MSKHKGPHDLGHNRSAKSKLTKATLAMAGAGVLAGALGGGQAAASDMMGPDELNTWNTTAPGSSQVTIQAAFKNVQDTMNWCTKNPCTTAGIVLSTTAIAATAYMAATGQIDADTITQTATQTSAKIAEFFNDPQPTIEYLKSQATSAASSAQTTFNGLQTQAGELAGNLSNQASSAAASAQSALGQLQGQAGDLVNKLSGQASVAVQNAQTLAGEGVKAFSQAASSNLVHAQNFLQQQGDTVAKSFQSVAAKLPPAQQAVMSGLGKIVDGVNAGIANGFEMAQKFAAGSADHSLATGLTPQNFDYNAFDKAYDANHPLQTLARTAVGNMLNFFKTAAGDAGVGKGLIQFGSHLAPANSALVSTAASAAQGMSSGISGFLPAPAEAMSSFISSAQKLLPAGTTIAGFLPAPDILEKSTNMFMQSQAVFPLLKAAMENSGSVAQFSKALALYSKI